MKQLQELVAALETIKQTCVEHTDNCATCPLGNSFEECYVIDYPPAEWKITDPVVRVLG